MLLYILITICALIYFYIKWNYSYWEREGFPFEKPHIPFGVLNSVIRGKRSLGMAIYDVYEKSTEKFLGIYLITRPALLIRDAQLAHDIQTKDFNSFHDRGVYVDEKNDPMSGHLFALEGKNWKNLRNKLSPSFSSGKLKSMFSTVLDVADKMLIHLNEIVPDEGVATIDFKKLGATFAIDIIASTIFGLEVNSFENPNNEFHKISNTLTQPNFTNNLRGTTQFLYPGLEKIFRHLGWLEIGHINMKELVRRTVEFREQNNIVRKDMLQMLLQLRNSGKINEDNDIWSIETASESVKASMSIDKIAGQLLLFYIAGYETTSATIAFTLYELAQYPELLEKAQKDVAAALEKHNGELTYEALKDMKYLELCITETIRKYPGLPILNRECTENYLIPGTKDKIIKKGTPIIIPLLGIHRDPEYFSDPLRYEPERYLEENKNYNTAAFMPFGEGPRQCIAQRMGRVNVKVAIVKIFTHFNIQVRKQIEEIEFDTYGVPLVAKGGVPVQLTKKKKKTL